MEHLYEKALESAEYIKMHTKKRPKIAVVLGSGLDKLTADFTDTEELSYKDIPNFPVSTVAGHKGALLAGKLGDTEVYAMEGRFHFYEGYSIASLTWPPASRRSSIATPACWRSQIRQAIPCADGWVRCFREWSKKDIP